MQAVILAAGRGKRMGALTDNLPKPMLAYRGRNLIEHKIAVLPPEIDEIVLIIGYLGDKIKSHFGDSFAGRKILYVEQNEPLGTAHAIAQARHLLRGRFIVMMGDDIYDANDVKRCLEHTWSIVTKRVEKPGRGARVVQDKNGHLSNITEAVDLDPGDHINTGLYSLHTDFFKYPPVQIPSGEYGLPQTLVKVAQDSNRKMANGKRENVVILETTGWKQITSPEDLD